MEIRRVGAGERGGVSLFGVSSAQTSHPLGLVLTVASAATWRKFLAGSLPGLNSPRGWAVPRGPRGSAVSVPMEGHTSKDTQVT